MKKKPTYEELERKIEQLEESEKKYRRLFETAMIGIYRTRIHDGKFLAANQTLARMMGYDSVEQFVEAYVASEHCTDLGRHKEFHDRIRTRGRVDGFEIEMARADGSLVTIEVSAAACPEFGYIEGIVADITERKRAEETLRKSEEKFRFLAEKMVDIVWTLDRDFRTTYVSPSIEHVLGFTPEERKQQSLEEMITPASFEKVQEMFIAELLKDEDADTDPNRSVTIEIEYYRKDGSVIWMENIVQGIRDSRGAIVGMHGVSRDITDRKSAEEALRESESRFRNLFDLSPQAIALTELETGKLVDVNHKLCELTGFSKEEILGLDTTEVGFYNGADRSRFLTALQTSGEVKGFEMAFKAKDDADLHTQVFARIIRIAGVSYILSIFHDCTEEKRLEAQLRQAHKMESIGTLAGGIAHDFNNILGIIIGNSELALDDIPEDNTARLNLEEIRIAGSRAKAVVSQLLSFARKTNLEKKPANIAPIIRESLKLLRSSIPKSIEIRQNIMEDIDTILADRTQINQILINLCTNADHAMPDGGILDICLRSAEIDDDTAVCYPNLAPGRYVNLMVSDTGRGIPSQEIDRIYDPYFTTKEVGKGVGMGLAVVHGIVMKHNGAIFVESEPEKGTTFNLFFPGIEREPVSELPVEEDPPGGKERILFIDDEESIVYTGRNRLERLGYHVETKTDPVKALELFREKPHRFDLVITDMTMPQMTGDLLVKEILKIRADMPTILCTGFSEKIDEEKAKEIGIRQYIEKPVNRYDLAKMIRKVLQ